MAKDYKDIAQNLENGVVEIRYPELMRQMKQQRYRCKMSAKQLKELAWRALVLEAFADLEPNLGRSGNVLRTRHLTASLKQIPT
jgi:hypothetical protein